MSPQRKKNQQNPKLERLQEIYHQFRDRFHKTHAHTSDWLQGKSLEVDDFRKKSQHFLAATSVAGSMLVNQPVDQKLTQLVQAFTNSSDKKMELQIAREEQLEVLKKLKSFINMPPGHMSEEDELYVEQQLSNMLGFNVTAELDGHRLNHSIGIMGGEQHLMRYPGDSLNNHDAFLEAGIAPARGAFGWFTENGELTQQAILNEKYYFAVQTLYLPDWNSNYQELKPWYQYRKMIMINPMENLAVVGVVGDAGPAAWVKKQFGGSPEVIREGKVWSPDTKGRVVLLFVDDPDGQVPLGKIDLSQLFIQSEVVEATT